MIWGLRHKQGIPFRGKQPRHFRPRHPLNVFLNVISFQLVLFESTHKTRMATYG